MILKDKKLNTSASPRIIAGQQQEKDVAFFLRRSFKDSNNVFIINDLTVSFNNETAQIDHLVVYPFGFILIESKSIKGEVKINANGEWSRTMGKEWVGMPSPIQQVELQQLLLRDYLFAHRAEILPKFLGIKTQSFGMRCWHNLCAISSYSMINRETVPADISEQVVKSEFIADKVKKIMKLRGFWLSKVTFDTRPDFSEKELQSITAFLLQDVESQPKQNFTGFPAASDTAEITCKKCHTRTGLTANYGRFGYFVKCMHCNTNTALKMPCPHCSSKMTKVTKKKSNYRLLCADCKSITPILISE